MKQVRSDILAAAATLSASILIAAYMMAPPRYAAFALYEGVFVRVDQRSGEVMRCGYEGGCQRVWIQPPADEVDNLAANIANEVIDVNAATNAAAANSN